MGKRSVIIILVLLISGLVLLGYFFRKNRVELLTDPYRVIPTASAVLIETADLQGFLNLITSGNSFVEEFVSLNEFSGSAGRLRYLSDMLGETGFKSLGGAGKSLISFQLNEKGFLVPLLAMTVPADIRIRQIADIIETEEEVSVSEVVSGKEKMLLIPFNKENGTDTLCVSMVDGVLICSPSQGLLRKALSQADAVEDIRNIPGFRKVFEASGKREDKIFIIPANMQELLAKITIDGLIGEELSASLFEGDIIVDEKSITLSGYSETTDSSCMLGRYKSSDKTMFTTYRILPASVALFATMVPARKTEYNTLTGNGCRLLAKTMGVFIEEEVSKVLLSDTGRSIDENRLMIYKLNDPVYAVRVFKEAILSGMLSDSISILSFAPDDQTEIPVYRLPGPGFGAYFFDDFRNWMVDVYFTFFDDYLVTGGSYEAVADLLYDNILNKTLANDLAYRDFEGSFPSVSSFCLYFVPGRMHDYFEKYLSDNIAGFIKSNSGITGKIEAVGYQLAPSNEMVYNSMTLRFGDEERRESEAEWQTLLDTVAAVKPFFFTNHNTGAREIFVQDMRNNAYLINSAGRVLWKVPLRERIMSQVFMIDYFRNGKYQLLFSGKDHLHLLDRNGNYVERYPVRLRSSASAPMALFDYDNTSDYRIFVPGTDRIIYAYDKTGSIVRGWKNFKTAGLVNREISWLRVSGKDYLVAADDRSLYFLDRTGNTRLTIREPVSCADNSTVRLSSGKEQSVVCTAPDGTVQHIYFDGTVKKYPLNNFSADHSFDLFDIDGDGFGEYIFIDRGILYLYDNNMEEMFKRDFGSARLSGPINFIFSSSSRKIGLFDADMRLIYLIGDDGETMTGFPLKGASVFSIGKLSDRSGWHLIVGGSDNFLYNYKLNTVN